MEGISLRKTGYMIKSWRSLQKRKRMSLNFQTSVTIQLLWDAAMAENRILKLGKQTDFQCRQMEYQLAAYTDCNQGEGLAVLHPAYYRHIYRNGSHKFKRFAVNVWGISETGKTEEETACEGVEAYVIEGSELSVDTFR